MKSPESRITLVSAIILILIFLLGARLWELQIVKGSQYTIKSRANRLRIEKLPAPRGIIYDRWGEPLVKNTSFFSVSLAPEHIQQADVEAIADFLGMGIREVGELVEKNRNAIRPVSLKGGLSFDEVAFIEARLSDFPALTIEVDETRHYPYGEAVAHVVGYLGKMSPEQIRKEDFRDVPRQSFIGQWGIEKNFDSLLRGTPGQRAYEVDAIGRKHRIISEKPAIHGNDLYLSIDVTAQKAAVDAFGGHAGALVALKPTTGEVLALVSRPSFDPNLFSRGINTDNWLKLVNHKGFPLLNRALQTQAPPGSVFKIIPAVTGLEEEVITPESTVICTGVVTKGPWRYRDWKREGHGETDLIKSLAESCDVYYYRLGEKTGIDAIARTAQKFQFGEESGLGLIKEKRGLIPDSAWKKRTKKEPWYLGETYNAAIGQGFVLTTPIQLAKMIAWVANNGDIYDLSLLKAEGQPEPTGNLDLKPDTLSVIRKGLDAVVNSEFGTGKRARSDLVRIAGKTGTAQVVRLRENENRSLSEIPYNLRDHAWFIAFAPLENPEIAVAVYVEHGGSGGRVAAPIAKATIEQYIRNMEKHAQD
jgi:penicillin-binding protein 2